MVDESVLCFDVGEHVLCLFFIQVEATYLMSSMKAGLTFDGGISEVPKWTCYYDKIQETQEKGHNRFTLTSSVLFAALEWYR